MIFKVLCDKTNFEIAKLLVMTAWFELEDGRSIGVRDQLIIYGEHSSSSTPIDQNVQEKKTLKLSDYPKGIRVEFNPVRMYITIDGQIYRFQKIEQAMAFITYLQNTFSITYLSEKKKTFFQVSRAPLSALIVLFVILIIGFVADPAANYGRRSGEALFVLLASIPKPALLIGYFVLSAIALGNAIRLWKRSREIQVFLVKSGLSL